MDYVCLPHDPNVTHGMDALHKNRGANMFAEYEDDVFGSGLQNKDAPCAVCISKHASNSIMVPGKTTCPNGWHLEYNGLLASNDNQFKAAGQFICVDFNAKPLEGGSDSKYGKLLYPVFAYCGTLRCPPYEQNKLLTCAVCSK